MHLRISNESKTENCNDDLMRDVQTVAELLLEPLITTLLVMDRDILSTITVKIQNQVPFVSISFKDTETVINLEFKWCYWSLGKPCELLDGNHGIDERKQLSVPLGQFGNEK